MRWLHLIHCKVTMKSISAVLKMPSSSLRKRLLALKMPTTARTLQKSAKSCSDHLSKPPQCYEVYQRFLADGERLTEQFIELLDPVCNYHMDFDHLMVSIFHFDHSDKLIECVKKANSFTVPTWSLPDVDEEFCFEVNDMFFQIPMLIQSLSNDEKHDINSELSVAFLYGKVIFPVSGIASPHLQGTFRFLSDVMVLDTSLLIETEI